jgi:hypothetical protein
VQLLASQPTKKWYIEHCYCHCFLLLVADDSGGGSWARNKTRASQSSFFSSGE